MAGQVNIKVDAGTGSPVDFSQTSSAANYRQVIAIGDPLSDANYANVSNGSVNVSFNSPIPTGTNTIGAVTVSGTPTVVLGAGSNVVGTVSIGIGSNVIGTVSLTNPIPSGSNVIGSISMTGSLPTGSNVVGSFSVSGALPSGNNTVGTVSMSGGSPDRTDVIFNTNSVAVTPQFGTIGFSALGNNVVVGTISGKRIRVVAMAYLISTATNLYWQDSTFSGLWGVASAPANFAANGGVVFPYNPVGWFQTGSGNALVANISASSSVSGSLTYLQI